MLRPEQATLRQDRVSESVRMFVRTQAHQESGSVHQDGQRPLRSVSAWHDFLVTVLLGAAIISILAYFLGWFIATAIMATIIAALALCLNFVIGHTIEF
jgi:fatty acid desaturase